MDGGIVIGVSVINTFTVEERFTHFKIVLRAYFGSIISTHMLSAVKAGYFLLLMDFQIDEVLGCNCC